MKKMIAAALCLGLLLLASPSLSLANSYYTVNNPNPQDRLHLRAQPQDGAPSLGKYYNGVVGDTLETSAEWVKVRIGGAQGGLEGYMKRGFLADASQAKAVKSAMPRYMSTSSGWELYDQPSAQGAYRMCGYGMEFQLMGFSQDWWHITTPDGKLTGFVPAQGNILMPPMPAVVNNPNPSDRLHLRTAPDISAASLGKYYNGVTVMIYGFAQDGQWAKVSVGTLEGYMNANYLAIGDMMADVGLCAPIVTVKVPAETEHLHLRAAPSTDAQSLGRFPNGAKVRVYGLTDSWVHVQVNGKEGFMMAQFLTPALPR